MANIELPKDAEGREIPLDVEVLYDEYGEKFLTDRATYMRKSGSWWFSGHFDLQSVQHRYMASRLHLTQPDSLKRLKEDLRRTMGASDAVCAYFSGDNRDCVACRLNKESFERAYAVGRMESSEAVARETARIIAGGIAKELDMTPGEE